MLSAFLRSFNQAYDVGNEVAKDYSIGKILRADGEEVNVPDLSGQGQTGSLDEQDTPTKKGIRFLGKVYDQGGKDQINDARQSALADVYQRYGDNEGADRIRSSLTANQLRRSQTAANNAATQQQTSATQSNQAAAFADQAKVAPITALGNNAEDRDFINYAKQYMSNPDGTERTLNQDDYLHLGQYQAAKLVGAGRLDEANQLSAQNMAMVASKIQADTVVRNQALNQVVSAARGGDFSGVKDFYNRYIPDGAQTSAISFGKDGKVTVSRTGIDGSALPDRTFGSRGDLLNALQSIKRPEALFNYANNEFNNNLVRPVSRVPAAPVASAAPNSGTGGTLAGSNGVSNILTQARSAIANGASAEQVNVRLGQMGIAPLR